MKKLLSTGTFIVLLLVGIVGCNQAPYPCDTPLARLPNVQFFSAADCGRPGNHHVLFVAWMLTNKSEDCLYFTGEKWSTNWSDALMIDDADSCQLKKVYRQWERSQLLDRDKWDSLHHRLR